MSTRPTGPNAPQNSSTRRRGTGTIIAVGAALVVVLLVLGAVVGEFYLRNRITGCLENQLSAQIGSPTSVELGSRPILLTALDDTVSSVTIRNQDGVFGNARGMDVEATVHNVVVDGSTPARVGSSDATVHWSADGIRQTLSESGIGPLLTDVTTDPATGTIRVVFGALAALTVAPEISGNSIEIRTIDASLLGLGIPTDLASSVVTTLSSGLQVYPLGMTPQTVQVDADGVALTLAGGEYSLNATSDTGAVPQTC